MTPLRILFFGTPSFAVPSLDALAASSHQVVAVVTQPDRPRGRGQRVTFGAVKARALELNLPVLQPGRPGDADVLDALRALQPDLGVVAAYGRILPQRLLDVPRLGMINVHASLLPRWRGAAPIHRAILAGDTVTGVTIMRVVQALDAGPMLARVQVDIDPNETSAALEARLAAAGAPLLLDVVDRLADPSVPAAEDAQNEREVTYAHRLERKDSGIDWARPARDVHNQIRGLHPWPLAAAMLNGKRVLILHSAIDSADASNAASGTVIAAGKDGLRVATADGVVRLTTLQLEGRPPVSVRDFLNGHRVSPGDRFEPLPVGP